jgi:hypothetical protein
MPAKMTAFFPSVSDNKYVILFLLNILLLVLGTPLDMAPSILIATPILLPVMQNFGVDPVHFGMIMLLNLGIGLYHPPVGAILFVRGRQGDHRAGNAQDPAVLRGDAFGADGCHLYSGNFAVAAAACAAPRSRAHALRGQAARALTDWTGAGDRGGCTVVDGSSARTNSA